MNAVIATVEQTPLACPRGRRVRASAVRRPRRKLRSRYATASSPRSRRTSGSSGLSHTDRGNHVLSSSFGAQAAVSLHLATQVYPDIPVVLVDTGYLFPETYRFVDELTERLKLNLKIYRSELSPAWQEARFGQRW